VNSGAASPGSTAAEAGRLRPRGRERTRSRFFMTPRFHIASDGQAAVDQEKVGGGRKAGGGKNEKFSAWGQRSSKALESRRFQGEKNCFGVRGQNEIRD